MQHNATIRKNEAAHASFVFQRKGNRRMIVRLIEWSLRNRLLVLLLSIAIAIGGIVSASNVTLDAIPDLSDVQVIVKTPYMGQPPQQVEDQVTYPLTTALLSVPGTRAVRGFSMFGESFIYIIFRDGTDPYWARSRVLESISQAMSHLPPGATHRASAGYFNTHWWTAAEKSTTTSCVHCRISS
jgi:Cu/Ag efflux pump CusA